MSTTVKFTLFPLILALVACPPDQEAHSRVVIGAGYDALTVVEDAAHGVVCYWRNDGGLNNLSCVKVR